MAPLAVSAETPETEGGRSSHDQPQQERDATTSRMSPAEQDVPTTSEKVLFPVRSAWRSHSTGLDPQGGPAAWNARWTSGRSDPPPQSADGASPQKPVSPFRACCRESSTTWAGWRWPWASFRPWGAPSCRGPPAPRSPAPRSAHGSPGSWRTPGPHCTGRWPRSTACWLRGPGRPVRRTLRLLPGGLRCALTVSSTLALGKFGPLAPETSPTLHCNLMAPCWTAASGAGTPGAPRSSRAERSRAQLRFGSRQPSSRPLRQIDGSLAPEAYLLFQASKGSHGFSFWGLRRSGTLTTWD
uniref:uncharacterized protein LOC118151908 n=1 Tax=Callithrix jacchus TaxID=9483 RepID=UPI00159F6987|nr:uncharacterized protein LOC118151908 [Callithrix jacchus]